VQNPTITAYGLKHGDPAAVREWLMQQPAFLNACGPALNSALLRIDPMERKTYEHLEYAPLINPRAHRAGGEWRIGNEAVRAQYLRLLAIFAHQPRLEREDRMAVSAFLLLQDRIAEAQTWFASVEPDRSEMALQYDYLKTVLSLLHGRLAEARTLALKHAQHPVDRWRTLFQSALEHLDVADGKGAPRESGSKTDRERETDQLAASEPSFEVETAGTDIQIAVRNLRSVQLKFYQTDTEFSFSANPFGRDDSGSFRFIKPALTLEKEVPSGATEVRVTVPAQLAARSLMVEVTGAGLRKAVNYSANRMRVDFIENYGRLEVREGAEHRPQAKVYVKVYARLPGGRTRFFKDGYTDIRGRFDYASLNSTTGRIQPMPRDSASPADPLEHAAILPTEVYSVEKFAVLLLGESGGAVIREVSAPSRGE
jgi:hypothetical protein